MKNSTQDKLPDEIKLNLAMQFMAAVKNNDRNLMKTILTEDAFWTLPGTNVLSGITKGADAISDKAVQILSYGVNIELVNSLYSLNGIALSVHNQGSKNGLVLEEYLIIEIVFKGDKIAAVHTNLSDIAGMNAFFSGQSVENNPDNKLSTEEKITIGNHFLTALKDRDWKLMRLILTEDVTWTLPGTSLLSGEAVGVDAVINRAKQLRNFGVMVQVNHILTGFNGLALSLHNTGARGNLILDQQVAIVCELANNKISRLTTHLHNVANINSFFVEGII